MGRRKPFISGPQRGQIKQRRRREKQRLSLAECVDFMEEKRLSNKSDEESNLKKERNVISSNTPETLGGENLDTLLQTTEILLQEKCRECVSPVDDARSWSMQSRRAKRRRKNQSTVISFEEDVHPCADTSSLSNIVVIDSVRKKNSETLIGDNLNPLLEEESVSLAGVKADSIKSDTAPGIDSNSYEVANNSSKRTKRIKGERKCKSFDFSRSTQEDASISLQVAPKFTSDNISSLVEVAAVEFGNKNYNEASHSDHLILPVNEGGLSKGADADILKNVVSHEINFKLNDVKSIKSGKQRRHRKRRKDKSFNTNTGAQCGTFANNLSILGIAKKDLERKSSVELSLNNNLMPPVEKETSAIVKGASASVEVKKRRTSKKKAKYMMLEENDSDNALVQKSEGCLVPLSLNKDKMLKALPLTERALRSCARKKLLVLDLNGLLCDIICGFRGSHQSYKKVGKCSVFKRPFCDDFLKFCCERFDIGVWSSRHKNNVAGVVSFIMGDINLSFCWDASKCTITGFKTIENTRKPLVLKEMKKLWNKEEADLPWEKGEYTPSNTLLIDDSPYKALCNPPHTGIFPYSYHFNDEIDDSLGPGGDLRVYLEGLALADDVQCYVREHPIGQHAITASNACWKFYERIINKIENSSASSR